MSNYSLSLSKPSLKCVCGSVLFVVFAFLIVFGAAPSSEAATDNFESSKSASSPVADSQKRTDEVKVQSEILKAASPSLRNQYNVLASVVNSCNLAKVVTEPTIREILSPTGNLCINGALAASDPTFNRFLTQSTGTGIQAGCPLSGSATAVRYDVYRFNLTSCAAFPTVVTATLCGPAGCATAGNTDTVVFLYRNVAAGDPLTGNGGLGGVFNPASPCTNARAAQDDLTGAATTTGGASCNQSNTADCLATCTGTTSNSGLKRNIGSGEFTVVVSGFSNTVTGNYNLFIDAPATGCVVALAPTAARVSISGRILTPQSSGLANALVTLTAPNGDSRTILTRGSGAFQFTEINVGETYILSVNSKRYRFTPRVITATEDLTEVNFMVEP